MLPGEIKGDAAFTSFQSKLATVVASARAIGKRIGVGHDCCCPLGAHPDSPSPFPFSAMAKDTCWSEVSFEGLYNFIGGFGLGRGPVAPEADPYRDLGRAYREMFP